MNPNELAALKASVRGAMATAAALASLAPRIEALGSDLEITAEDLDELARVSAAHAIASAALRGFVNTVLVRRGVAASGSPGGHVPSEVEE